jgi:autotransporter-associated beta strand protein
VRLSKDQTVSTTGGVYVSGGGVLEIGADLNGATAGDLSHALGTTTGIRFFGDSGLSASGTTDRVVNFGGSSAQIAWGRNAFLTDADGITDGGYTLKLSSAKADAKLTIQNPIALGANTNRVIDVANGTAATDATLSGVLSGNGATLTKNGTGTLELAAANTYSGGTIVSAGTLAVGASGSINNSTRVDIKAGATFDTTAQSFVMLGSQTFNFTLDPTTGGSAGLLDAASLDISLGVVTFTTLGSLDDTVYILANYTGLVGTQFASVTAPTGYTINYGYNGGTQIALQIVPEPGSTAMILFGLGMLVGFQRVRRRR